MDSSISPEKKLTVSLVNPPQSQLREPMSYVPLGLAYIGSSLLGKGFDVVCENLADRDGKNLCFKHGHSDVFMITYPSSCRDGVKAVIDHVTKEYPHSILVLGGAHPSVVHPSSIFDDVGGDVIITGEAEESAADFLSQPKHKEATPKSVFHSGIVADLNRLKFPARELFDRTNVVSTSGIHGCEKGVNSTTIISSRGCPYQCNFCCRYHPMYSRLRFRSPENIRDELICLEKNYGIEHVRFIDDCFTFNSKRVKKICEYTKKLDISFMCISRADLCGSDMLHTLRYGGCTTLDIGVESGSDRLLKLMNKKESSEQMKRCILNAKRIGLKVKVFLQYGLPYETVEDINNTLEFLGECKPDSYTLSKFTPLEGSEWGKKTNREKGWFYDDDDIRRVELINKINDILEIDNHGTV